MNLKDKKKQVAAGIGAGVLALSLIGGGTFALWSDFDTVDDNLLAAGTLVIDAGDSVPLNMGNLAPGENKATTIFIANRSDDTAALQDASLSLSVNNLEDVEDGCASNSERTEDSTCTPGDPNGEFADEAYMQLRVSNAVSAGDCTSATYQVMAWKELSTYDGTTTALGQLDPGQGVCIRIEAGLPSGQGNQTPPPGIDAPNAPTATNLSQGDSSVFDVRFDLTQNLPA